jgi:hypothetical protein
MQVVWYLAHMSLNLKTTLFQTRPAKFTVKKDRPELIKISMERSAIGLTALYHQQDIKKSSSDNYFTTPGIARIYENARKVALTDEVSVVFYNFPVEPKLFLIPNPYSYVVNAILGYPFNKLP